MESLREFKLIIGSRCEQSIFRDDENSATDFFIDIKKQLPTELNDSAFHEKGKWGMRLDRMDTTVDFRLLSEKDRTFYLSISTETEKLKGTLRKESFRENRKLFIDFALEVNRILADRDLPRADRPTISQIDGSLRWSSQKVHFNIDDGFVSTALGFNNVNMGSDEFTNELPIDHNRGRKTVTVTCDALLPQETSSQIDSDQVLATLELPSFSGSFINKDKTFHRVYPFWCTHDLCFTLMREDGSLYRCVESDNTFVQVTFREMN